MYINDVSIPSGQITSELKTGNTYIFYVQLLTADLPLDESVIFRFVVNSEFIYSEIYEIKSTTFLLQNEICKIIASNNDNRHGYLSNQAFGFFKYSKFDSDIFLEEVTEYKYSYSRNEKLKVENQIGKRFTFLDLTMYNRNLLRWLCNCSNLYIDGVKYTKISAFTEILNDKNSEIMDLQADFVEVNQSFFSEGSTKQPSNIFINQFFIK
jgi:hypothetical protein